MRSYDACSDSDLNYDMSFYCRTNPQLISKHIENGFTKKRGWVVSSHVVLAPITHPRFIGAMSNINLNKFAYDLGDR